MSNDFNGADCPDFAEIFLEVIFKGFFRMAFFFTAVFFLTGVFLAAFFNMDFFLVVFFAVDFFAGFREAGFFAALLLFAFLGMKTSSMLLHHLIRGISLPVHLV